MRRIWIAGAGAALVLVGVASTDAQIGERPSIRALRVDRAPIVDGVPDEAVWASAPVGSGFSSREPVSYQPASEKTEFSVVYTSDTLFFGIRAFDSDPKAIIAKEMERDSQLGLNDDSIAIVLDTFRDGRNSYTFEVNPNGARTDSLVTDEGRSLNLEWDGVWTAAAKRSVAGWFAEVAIPFKTLRFDPEIDAWGLNVRRLIRHRNEEVNWAAIGREIGPRNPSQALYAAHWVSLAGTLEGLEGIRDSRQLDVKPYVIAHVSEGPRDSSGRTDDSETGIDFKWGITRSLTVDLTYNTDFAEVEVDQQEVNLTRFSLFFPEKREFFLENAGLFTFGPPNRGAQERETTLLEVFFSRRIGLDQGLEVPIEWGGRVTGRVAGWNVGVLHVLTEGVNDSKRGVADTAFTVTRMNRNIGRRSTIGAIFTARDADRVGQNRVFGLDLNYKPSAQSEIFAYGARSDDPDAANGDPRAEDDASWGLGYFYRSRDVRASVDVVTIERNFRPEVGFLLRSDIRRYDSRVRYTPPINRFGIRNWFIEAVVDYFERDSLGVLESRKVQLAPIGTRSFSEDLWRLAWVGETEQLFEPFEIRPGVTIPAGLYTFDGWELAGRSNPGRLIALNGQFARGDFFGGTRDRVNLTPSIRASKHVRAEVRFNYNDVELPEGVFTTRVYSAGLDVSFTPDLRLNTLAQYNGAAELVGLNVRFNWIYRPGADLFIVYNENWDAPTFSARETTQRQLVVKFSYLFSG
ncbi:MAG: DUF5916 domain-containing protein [Acidobacteriota bacterium]|nr:DUF5916 domain-containing protein [Acidobacteriota bacterium]